MKIRREWFGWSEIIDLDTEEGRDYFINDVVQDEETAEQYIAELRGFEVGEHKVVNATEPEFREVWTVVADSTEPEHTFTVTVTGCTRDEAEMLLESMLPSPGQAVDYSITWS